MVIDSSKDNSFHVFVKDKVLKFVPSKNGLYYCDNKENRFCMLESVAENREFYTPRQYERAKVARQLYQTIGTPSVKDFKAILQMNLSSKPVVKVHWEREKISDKNRIVHRL